MPQRLAELIGPYEQWAHGTGACYSPGGADMAATPYIAAVAELSAGTNPTIMLPMDMHADPSSGRATVYLPTLWQPAFQQTEDSSQESVFCPLVLRVPRIAGSHELRRLKDIASCLDHVTNLLKPPNAPSAKADLERPPDYKSGASSEFGYRVNTAISEDMLNTGFMPNAIARRCPRRQPDERLPAAIMAVIDDGIPFAHRNLRDKDNRSRVEFCWLQGAKADADHETHSVLFGREYTRDDIDRLIETFGHDEDTLYATLPNEWTVYPGETINRFGTHGSHVLDMAAGHRHGSTPDPMRPVGEDGDLDAMRIIAVQLPALTKIDTSSFGKDAFILSAFHYIFDRADQIEQRFRDHFRARKIPLIINFSYGFSGGPHNGRDRLERAIRALIQRRRGLDGGGQCTHLVMPAGNDFLSKLFGRITPNLLKSRREGDDAFDLPWRIQPSDHTSNFLEIWFPSGASPDGISVEVRDPTGQCVYRETIRLEDTFTKHANITRSGQSGGATIGQFSIEHYRTGRDEFLWRLFVTIAPTEPDDLSLPAARAGLWTVKLVNIGEVMKKGPISCRIQRDTSFGQTRGARQSYFDDCFDETFDDTGTWAAGENPERAFVRRVGTINGLATHDSVTVVGGYVGSSGRPAPYSAVGASVGSFEPGTVHHSAPSETSYAVAGVPAAGTRSGVVFHMSGTSTAAPQVAREFAVGYLRSDGSRFEMHISAAAHSVELLRSPVEVDNEVDRSRLRRRLLRTSNTPYRR
jgi:hypothetical protein